jgi:hypothetical protein
MEVLYPHCAGLDSHKDSVVACVRHFLRLLARGAADLIALRDDGEVGVKGDLRDELV